MENFYRNIIGSGASFPILLSQNSDGTQGWNPLVGDPQLIVDNLTSVFIHNIGERFNQEDFGTRLMECIEEPNTQALSFLVNQFIREAISKYEGRVTYKESNITLEGSKITIDFFYTINQTSLSGSGSLSYDINK